MMTSPRVLYISRDRSTKAAVASSVSETDATVTVVEPTAEPSEWPDADGADAVVVDADTVDVPDAIDEAPSDTATFLRWNGTEPVPIGEPTTLEDAISSRPDTSGLTDLVDTVKLRLFDAMSPGVIDRVVRETLVADDRIAFTWIGEYDRGEREIVPWVTETPTEWSINRTFGVGNGDTPAIERALRDRELQVLEDVDADPTTVPLGADAVRADVRSVTIAPLSSPDEIYGVLAVYASEELGDAERDAIHELAAAISRLLEFIAVRGRLPQLERSLHRYERLVETAGDGMYVLDEEGHFTTVNAALVEMTGYSREGLLGEHVSLVFDDEDVDAWTGTVRRLLDEGDATDTVEMTIDPKTGDPIPCETQLALLERDGAFVGTVGVLRDVTERKRREQKLQEQNERLDAFARIVSHDLRNPLSVSTGYLDVLTQEEEFETDYAEHIRDSLERMEAIVEDVLSIAREGEWASDVEPVDLESTAETAWEHVSTPDTSLEVETNGEYRIDADRSRLLRLLENLFRNAVEHGDADVVRVGVLGSPEPSDGFYVEDDGSGLPGDLHGRIFDPSVSTSSEGLGLGLWIVREVANGHGWTVTATDGAEGGARFEFES